MSFSIITVALDAADTLPATLESILAQDFEAVQTILVDGTSTDATPEVIARYKDAVDVVAEVFDAGIFYAMNAALAHATGDYVLFMNAGDRFLAEDTLSAVWARRVGDPDIIYGDHLYAAGGRTTLTRAGDMAELAATLKEGRLSPAWQSAIPAHQATSPAPASFRPRATTPCSRSAPTTPSCSTPSPRAPASTMSTSRSRSMPGAACRPGATCAAGWNSPPSTAASATIRPASTATSFPRRRRPPSR